MSLDAAIASFTPRPWARRAVPWIGGLFIAVIVALAAYDIVRSYQTTISNTGRELETQARVIAEQTARSLQAVDVVLRHVDEQFRAGTLSALSREDLRAYLREQAVGLVQIDGLVITHADGTLRASSYIEPEQEATVSVSGTPAFEALRRDRSPGLFVGSARKSAVDGQWFFPIARRLDSSAGEFWGVAAARGRIEYFQQFYRDIRLEQGTKVTLTQQDGTLLARHPPVESALGKRFPVFDEILASRRAGDGKPTRAISPIDGVERFGALEAVPDYPLMVLVTREAAMALAPWRAQSLGTALRTLALSVLAALLLVIVLRQLARVYEARESLEASRERFALAVAGSDDGIWDFDFAAGRVFASARAREILGLATGPDTQPMDKWFASLQLHPEDAPRRLAAMEAHLAGQAPAYVGEFRVRHPDGSYRWVRIHGLCIRDATGKPHRLAGSVSDIDARKRAEDSLRQSEERFALAVAGSNDGVLDWDIVDDRMFTSERAMRIAGVESDVTVRTRAEWVAMLQIHPDDAERHTVDFRRHLEGHTSVREGEYRVRHPDGQYRWVRVRGMCVRDGAGRAIRWAGSVSDIDARKRVEAALRESEERYQLAVAGANQGLWDWDLVRDTLVLSARAQEFMGLEPSAQLRPRREWIALSTYHPDDVDVVRHALSDHLRGVTEHFAVEYRLRHPSSSWHWYRQRGIALRDAHGRPYRMAGSMEDITDRKQAEGERDRLEGQLLQAQKLEAIGTLAGGIAHDFNNILAAILGDGEMAQKDAPQGTALRRHIDAAVNAGMRAKSLVERILAFSRSGMSERVLVHVQSVVVEALDLVAAGLPSGMRLDRELAAGDAAITGDPTQVHQVVMNLCANAVQAMKSRGTLTVALDLVEMPESTVATSVLASGKYIRLAVRDTGSGIAPHVLERIFDPFFTTKEVGVGTGLGLSLVHGIVTDLGGGIDVESRIGAGATFTVYLPTDGAVAAPARIEEAIPNGAGETILLVDDEEALVRLGEEMIAELGYEPVGFTSSTAALAEFRAAPERFNAVLSDETMPAMTGSELAQEIRKIRPDIPIVLMSGFVTPALAAGARDAGVADVLAKPLVARDIARSLASALRRNDAPRERTIGGALTA